MDLRILLPLLAVFSRTLACVENIQTPAQVMAEMIQGCNKTYACHVAPKNCIATNTCVAAVTVKKSMGLYHFEVISTKGVWVAVGIGKTDEMDDSTVVDCVCNAKTSKVEIFVSWNYANNTNVRTTKSTLMNLVHEVILKDSSNANGVLRCHFTRQSMIVEQNMTFNLCTTPYHLLLAAGSKLQADGSGLVKHDIVNYGSPKSYYLDEPGMMV